VAISGSIYWSDWAGDRCCKRSLSSLSGTWQHSHQEPSSRRLPRIPTIINPLISVCVIYAKNINYLSFLLISLTSTDLESRLETATKMISMPNHHLDPSVQELVPSHHPLSRAKRCSPTPSHSSIRRCFMSSSLATVVLSARSRRRNWISLLNHVSKILAVFPDVVDFSTNLARDDTFDGY
jgi:hypothetical protein